MAFDAHTASLRRMAGQYSLHETPQWSGAPDGVPRVPGMCLVLSTNHTFSSLTDIRDGASDELPLLGVVLKRIGINGKHVRSMGGCCAAILNLNGDIFARRIDVPFLMSQSRDQILSDMLDVFTHRLKGATAAVPPGHPTALVAQCEIVTISPYLTWTVAVGVNTDDVVPDGFLVRDILRLMHMHASADGTAAPPPGVEPFTVEWQSNAF